MKFEFATFGGGCFWGVEKFLQDIPGVIDAVSGYAGGKTDNPTYHEVCGGETEHAEVVNVEFDPNLITFEELLLKFLKSYRDTLPQNKESKSQYRSIIFYRSEEEKKKISLVFKQFENDNGKILTTQVEPFKQFYKAEDYHQDYYGSCRIN